MKIMVCYDGTNSAKEALNLALKHAEAFGATVDIVTSMRAGTENQMDEIAEAERSLEWAKSVFEAGRIPCETHLLIRGLPAGEDLVHFAEDNGVSEIFIGVKKRSKVGKMLMGSTAQTVILNAPCPVMTVK